MTALPPVVCSIEVAAPLDHAFATFTEGIDKWWPATTHSVGEERVTSVVLENRLGGSFYEEWDDDTRHDWGQVIAWEPPHRLVVSWHPGMDVEEATEVEVTFSPSSNGTIVELTHRNWEKRGALAAEKREMYESGWPISLQMFRDEVERSTSDATP